MNTTTIIGVWLVEINVDYFWQNAAKRFCFRDVTKCQKIKKKKKTKKMRTKLKRRLKNKKMKTFSRLIINCVSKSKTKKKKKKKNK